jgi:hypothetical protein
MCLHVYAFDCMFVFVSSAHCAFLPTPLRPHSSPPTLLPPYTPLSSADGFTNQTGGGHRINWSRKADTQPTTLHDHVPNFLGSKDILEIERALKEAL